MAQKRKGGPITFHLLVNDQGQWRVWQSSFSDHPRWARVADWIDEAAMKTFGFKPRRIGKRFVIVRAEDDKVMAATQIVQFVRAVRAAFALDGRGDRLIADPTRWNGALWMMNMMPDVFAEHLGIDASWVATFRAPTPKAVEAEVCMPRRHADRVEASLAAREALDKDIARLRRQLDDHSLSDAEAAIKAIEAAGRHGAKLRRSALDEIVKMVVWK